MRRKTNIKQFKQEIISEYLSGKTMKYLGEKYSVNVGSISYLLSKEKTPKRNQSQAVRRYQINENYFDSIDSAEKSYFLGLLYADGCNSPEQNLIRLILSETDKPLLIRLSSIIYKQYKPLIFREGQNFIDKGKEYHRQNSYQLSISNKHISETLVKHGLIKAKSLTVTFPKWLDEKFISHFIRGYFDGDGSISITNNQISISILGTENFCSSLQDITRGLSIRSSLCHAKKGSPIKQFVIHGNQTGRKFLEWIYRDAGIYLDRKHKRYLEILTIIPRAKPTKCLCCNEKPYTKGYCKKHYYEFIGRKMRHEHYMKTKTLTHYL